MGTAYLRKRKDAKNSKWYVEYFHGGKRIRRLARGAENKGEAKIFLREIERQIYQGEYIPKKKKEILFEVWSDRYLEFSKLNKASWKRDKVSLDHLISFFGGKLLQNITPLLVEDYKRKRKAEVSRNGETSGATINRELSCLKHMLYKAIDENLIQNNPVKKVRFFKEDNIIWRTLTQGEREQLIAKSEGYIKPIIIIALYTGMRRGEILILRWSQVDFSRKFIYVEKTKSGRPRSIPMNSLVEKTLKKLEQRKENDEYVFWNSKTQKPIQTIQKPFEKVRKLAGLDNLRFHDLRHNFATSMIENGVDIVTVSELLGHSDINLTAKRYSHPSPTHKRQAVEGLLAKKEQKSVEVLTETLTEGVH